MRCAGGRLKGFQRPFWGFPVLLIIWRVNAVHGALKAFCGPFIVLDIYLRVLSRFEASEAVLRFSAYLLDGGGKNANKCALKRSHGARFRGGICMHVAAVAAVCRADKNAKSWFGRVFYARDHIITLYRISAFAVPFEYISSAWQRSRLLCRRLWFYVAQNCCSA